MKTFKCLLALCLVALFVGCDNLPKNPPLTDEEPFLLVRIQPELLPTKQKISEEVEKFFSECEENEELKELVDEWREEFESGETEHVFSTIYGFLKDLKKNNVKNIFVVVESDITKGHTPFCAFDVHKSNESQVKSAEKAIESFAEDVAKSEDSEISTINKNGYVVTNFENSKREYFKKEIDYLEDKISDDMLKVWPKDIKKGLVKYQKCGISGVCRIPSVWISGMKKELEYIESLENAKDFATAAKKSVTDLEGVSLIAFGADSKTQTISVSFFVENKEAAEDLTKNALKTLTEFLKAINKEGKFGVDKKDIDKFVKDINISISGNVVTCTVTKEWADSQKSFMKKWAPKDRPSVYMGEKKKRAAVPAYDYGAEARADLPAAEKKTYDTAPAEATEKAWDDEEEDDDF